MDPDYTVASQVTLYISPNTNICKNKIENFYYISEIVFDLRVTVV